MGALALAYFFMRLSGADIVQHSATKYFAGHSDALGGVLVVKSEKEADQLRSDRNVLGSVLGSLEAWLLLRSLRQVAYVYGMNHSRSQRRDLVDDFGVCLSETDEFDCLHSF